MEDNSMRKNLIVLFLTVAVAAWLTGGLLAQEAAKPSCCQDMAKHCVSAAGETAKTDAKCKCPDCKCADCTCDTCKCVDCKCNPCKCADCQCAQCKSGKGKCEHAKAACGMADKAQCTHDKAACSKTVNARCAQDKAACKAGECKCTKDKAKPAAPPAEPLK